MNNRWMSTFPNGSSYTFIIKWGRSNSDGHRCELFRVVAIFRKDTKGHKIVGTKYGWAISTKLIFMGVAVNKLNVAR